MSDAAALSEAAARTALDALDGLTWTPFTREALPEVAAFYAVVEEHDANPERTSLDELVDYVDSPRSVPEEDTLLGRNRDGQIIATAWAGCNRPLTEMRSVFLGGAVHPDRRGQGLGRAVLAWELAHGRCWDATTRQPGFGPLRLRLMAPTDQVDARHLAERAGLPVARYFYEMERPLGDLPTCPVPDGVHLVDWDAARSEQVRTAINTASRDHWGHADATPEMWRDQLEASTFRPGWTVLAVEDATDDVVGVAWGSAYAQDWSEDHREGYTEELGVLREHRGHGLASALLAEQMRRFAADGMDAACLGVDTENPSGALSLYERLGYRPTASTCVHELIEEPAPGE